MTTFTNLGRFALLLSLLLATVCATLPSPVALAFNPTRGSYDCTNVTELETTECQALVEVARGIQGAMWWTYTDWLTDFQPCGWKGVTCAERRVVELDLSGFALRGTLPAALGQFSNLYRLDLADNELNALPAEVQALTTLQHLQLNGNQLTTLPNGLGQLTNLQSVNLSNNRLTILPVGLGNLRQLVALQLSGNRLGQLPADLGNLAALRSLEASNNQLTHVPPELGQLTSLIMLDLSNNYLRDLPLELGNLVNLAKLNLGNNLLATIPAALSTLSNLTSLSLGNNRLTASPAHLTHLPNLQRLYLEENGLATLPPGVEELGQLRTLTLHHNLLLTGALTQHYTKLPLQTLSFGGTQLCEPVTNGFQRWAKSLAAISHSRRYCESLILDQTIGTVGSVFTLHGRGFQPEESVGIALNQTPVITLTADSGGSFTLHLTTAQADVGTYFITAAEETAVTTSFVLQGNAPLYVTPVTSMVADLPAGLAYQQTFYLPWIAAQLRARNE